MSKRVVKSTTVSLGGTAYTSQIRSAELAMESDAVETTNMGGTGWREFLAGLKGATLALEFVKDADLSGLDLAVWTAFDAGTLLTFAIRGTSAAAAADNPEFTGSVVITEWMPISGAVGDAFSGSVSWQVTGAIARGTGA